MTLTIRALASLCLCFALGLARAQDNAPPEADPPDRAARLSFIQGDVSMQPAGEDQWAPAVLNRPLTTGDKLWTEQGARAEIQVGAAAVRLDSGTGFSFLNVDDDTVQMRMTDGVLNVRVHALDGNDHVEIDTPNVALSLLRPGNYRVEVNEAGDSTVVKISEGEAEATSSSQDVIVHNQQATTFRGTDRLTAQVGTLGAPDEFDSWSLERDRRDDRAAASQTAQYVAPEVTGYEDLDNNGAWSSDPEYGNVWTPTHVAVGWAPYQYGRWMWVNPWGWTWVDDASWGYAPFHYGRWASIHNRWCWVPGPRHVRAVYAPALVGWVGSPGVGVSVSFGAGGVGWFPLGPREVYMPARRFSPRYVERVNVTNTVIVNRTIINEVYENRATNVTYRNRSVPGAVTVVSQTTFTSSARVNDHRVRVSDEEIAHTRVIAAAPHIVPVRESRMGVSEANRMNVRTPPPTIVNRQVIVKRNPPPAAAHFARNNVSHGDAPRAAVDRPTARPQTPERPQNAAAPDRAPQNHEAREPGNASNGTGAVAHNPTDRPPHAERPAVETAPRPPATTPEQHVSAARPPEDKPHQDRPPRQQQEHAPAGAQQEQREPDVQQHQQRQTDQQRQQHEQQQARDRQAHDQQVQRENAQHQQESQRQAAAQQAEQHVHNAEPPHAPKKPEEAKPKPPKKQQEDQDKN